MNDLPRIKEKFMESINTNKFCNEIKYIWEEGIFKIIKNITYDVDNLIDNINDLNDVVEDSFDYQQNSKFITFQIVNLLLLMINIGCNFEIEYKKNKLRGSNILDIESFIIRSKEFSMEETNN